MLDRVKRGTKAQKHEKFPYCPYVIRYHSELSAEQFPSSETYGNRIEIWEEAHDFTVAEQLLKRRLFRNLRDKRKITDRAKISLLQIHSSHYEKTNTHWKRTKYCFVNCI